MQQFLNVLGPEGSKFVIWVLVALGVAIGLALLIWLGLAVFGRSLNMSSGSGRGQPQRLGITGAFNIDRKGRKLVIVRRDNVEHLVMIGGPNDVLVESNIVRAERSERTVRAPARPGAIDPQDVVLTETPAPVLAAPAPAPLPVTPVPAPQVKAAPPPAPAPAPVAIPEPQPVLRAPVAPPPQPMPRPVPAPPQVMPAPPPAAVARPAPAPVPPAPPQAPVMPAPPPVMAPVPAPELPVQPVTAPPARRPVTDPMLSDMAKRLQSVLQRPAHTAQRRVDPGAEASAETIPIPLPSARPAPPAPDIPSAPRPQPPQAAQPPVKPASAPVPPAPAQVTQGKTVPVPSPKAETPTIDSLEEEMARLLGRPGPDKA